MQNYRNLPRRKNKAIEIALAGKQFALLALQPHGFPAPLSPYSLAGRESSSFE
jgi:hypothetical protein